jgi:uncharacterized protein (DUF433 family)
VHRRFAKRALEPRYGFPEAAQIIDKPAQTIRRWSVGHNRNYRGERAIDEPLIQIDGDREMVPLSFLNLIELRFLASYRTSASLPAIRRALDYTAQELGVARPLLETKFATHGRDLFLRFAEDDPYFINASKGGQIAWPQGATELFESLEYDPNEHAAFRWWPLGKQTPVLLDTRLNGGRPSTAESGVRTVAIANRAAQGWEPTDIANDVAASVEEVQAALQLEAVA